MKPKFIFIVAYKYQGWTLLNVLEIKMRLGCTKISIQSTKASFSIAIYHMLFWLQLHLLHANGDTVA